MNIIIPLGGKGERFKNEGYLDPKPLIKVFGKEILFYVIDNLFLNDKNNNINRDINIYIIYNKELDDYNFSEIIIEKYKNIKSLKLIKLDYDTRGAAETVYIGINEILKSDTFINSQYKKTLLIDGDTFYTRNIIDMFYDSVRDNNNNGSIFYTNNENPNPIFSYISFKPEDKNQTNIVEQIIEKVKISNNANTGAYGFADIYQLQKYAKYILDNNITFKNEFYTSCIIDSMIKDGFKFIGIELKDEDVHVLGTPLQVREFSKKKS
jgi:dTDP-glucose pyrophosphorylase